MFVFPRVTRGARKIRSAFAATPSAATHASAQRQTADSNPRLLINVTYSSFPFTE